MATLNPSVEAVPAQTTSKQRWLYSIANLGNVIPYQAVGAILLFYYTDFKHLPVKWAAMAMTVYAIYNALNNPVMGYFSDRTRSRWGRRIPWLLFLTLPCMVAFAFIWMAPFDGIKDPGKLLAYFFISCCLSGKVWPR
jgi:glycoside/pentoside/hexuronide:cation symporter, GPH family